MKKYYGYKAKLFVTVYYDIDEKPICSGVDPGTENLTHSWTFNDKTPNDYVGNANGTLMGGAVIEGGL